MQNRKCSREVCFVAFGVGLLAASMCPAHITLVVTAAALVVVGVLRLRH